MRTAVPSTALVCLLVLTAVLGACTSGSPDGTPVSPSKGPATPAPASPEPPAPTRSTPPTASSPMPGDPLARTLPSDLTLVWTRSRLPDGYAERLSDDPAIGAMMVGRVAEHALVRTTDGDGTVVDEVAATGGWVLPVEVIAVDPSDHAAVFDTTALAGLAPQQAVLGGTSAGVRGLGVGGRLVFADGTELEVVAVLPDELVGGAEVLVSNESPLTVDRDRFVLARPATAGTDLEPVLRAHLPPGRRATVARPGDTPILRHADAVLWPAKVKELFGEFAMREAPGRGIEQDPAWVEANIATGPVPILGEVTCHRDVLPAIRAVLSELVDEGRRDAVDPADYAGCWSPRRQAVGEPLSHHAWGIAIDLNAAANPFGGASRQDPRLVELMRAHGFTWGEPWLVPDPMHFEAGHGWEDGR